MKAKKTLPTLVFFLVFAATAAAAPAAEVAAASQDRPVDVAAGDPGCPFPPGCNEEAGETQAAATEIASAEPLAAPADCADPLFAGDPPFLLKCGYCASPVCVGATVNSVCGYSGSQVMRCIDEGEFCPDSPRRLCTCRIGPI